VWLYDVHLLSQKMTPESCDQLVESALGSGLGAVCADALRAAAMAFGREADALLLARLERHRQAEPAARMLTAGRWRWAWSDLRHTKGVARRLRLVGELLRNQLH
jgi:hypothetical protein